MYSNSLLNHPNKKQRLQPSQSTPKTIAPNTKKRLVPPTLLPPPDIPTTDPSIWDNAFLLVDKPKSWTSFDVCNKIRGTLAKLLNKKPKNLKVGHAGTLDPMATGLLIICVGKGTKSIDTFMAQEKGYTGTIRLGQGTPSYDAESEVNEELPWEHITDDQLTAAVNAKLIGDDLQQVPPMFSAIRVDGKRLYELARKGDKVERKARSIRVDSFVLSKRIRRKDDDNSNDDGASCTQTERDIDFEVHCGKGTYVRSLAYDLGREVGTVAHLTALRRISIGEYKVDDAWSVDDFIRGIMNDNSTTNN
jgi:tRNA pseudouridine55 synthase